MNSPQMLPDAQTLLFTLGANVGSPDGWDQARVVVQSLGSGERKTLIEGGSHARYVPTGHLVYARGGVLFAVPFDLKRLEVTAGPVPIVEGVWRTPGANGGSALFSVSDTGSLIYVPGPTAAWSAQSRLALIDREGVVAPLKVPPGLYAYPRVSPDGTRLAFGTSDGKEAVVSIYELSGASAVQRITFGGNNSFPIWSADGQRVAFQSDREGDPAVFWQPAIGGTAERLTKPDPGTSHTPESWSPAGEVLLFSETRDFVSSLWTFSLKDRKATPFSDVKGSSLPTNAMFSPNGRWVAYQIGTAGVTEGITYIQPFPPTGEKYQIAPRWAPVVVPRRQGAVLRAGAGPLHGRRREDGTELDGHESGHRASRIRGRASDHSAHIRHHARRPDCRRRHGRPEPKWIIDANSASADSSRAELVRGVEVESASEVAIPRAVGCSPETAPLRRTRCYGRPVSAAHAPGARDRQNRTRPYLWSSAARDGSGRTSGCRIGPTESLSLEVRCGLVGSRAHDVAVDRLERTPGRTPGPGCPRPRTRLTFRASRRGRPFGR